VTALAHELAPDVRVNGVAPGGTLDTDLRGPRTLGLDDRRLGDAPDRAAELAARTPLHVALSPADHAWSYVFLASTRSRGLTGEVVHPDGGIGVKT
jgi:NAD(P)-dependent dehydrogenase (short-subunit alcohol dehydrogenase family)